MQSLTINIYNESLTEKVIWLLEHFKDDGLEIVSKSNNEIDASKLSPKDFDYISDEKMEELKQISSDYKNGKKDDFQNRLDGELKL